MKKTLVILTFLTILLALFLIFRPKKLDKETVIRLQESNQSKEEAKSLIIPEKYLIEVPFTSQSPFATWDEDENVACEEASLVMAWHWLEGDILGKINPTQAEEEIRKLIAFENEKYGNSYDTSAKDTAQTFKDYYKSTNIALKYDFAIDDIVEEISKGNIVIVPADGIALYNPNFKQPGPETHMLVIKGYDQSKKEFITNDPGTRKGQSYVYTYDILFKAIRDYPTGNHEVISGIRKAMLIVNK